ncbi:MAG TPA: AAA family ATPase [bacterium]|nr:AAA family ATPase [bacterium]
MNQLPVTPALQANGESNATASTEDTVAAIGLAILANVPLALRGAPGTGKTSLVLSIADALRWPIHTMTATIHDATDFAGLSFLSSSGSLDTRTMRASLQWAVALGAQAVKAGGDGLVFFDDIAYAPPAVQNALLQIVQQRRVGDFQLPLGVRCAAALNPLETATSMQLLTAPLANRMVHITWAPDADSWSEGYLSGWHFTLPTLPEGWQRRLSATRTGVAAFVRSQPSFLHSEPAEPSAQSRPWPSGRTWDMVSTVLAACDAADANANVRWLLTAGAVGEIAAAAYLAWEREASFTQPHSATATAFAAGQPMLKPSELVAV